MARCACLPSACCRRTTTPSLPASFLKILSTDDEPETRREAASALGHFVELGELERIPASLLRQVEDALLEKANGNDQTNVRRRALESLGYSSRPEVATLIQSSIQRENPDWQASALVAMGLSSDERLGRRGAGAPAGG